MQPTHNEYKRSPVVYMAKSVVMSAKPILPLSVFNILYNTAYSAYRRIMHVSYAVRVTAARASNRREEVQRGELILRVMPYSLVGAAGLEATHDVVREVCRNNIPGDIVECGVAQGGSAALMILTSQQHSQRERQFWLFDSYEGLPEPTTEDFGKNGLTGLHVRPLPKGSCRGTYEQVSELLFDRLGLKRTNVHMIQGWFQDTLPETRNEIEQISVLRLDGDWYESTKVCLENLYDKVADGGFVIVDDYASCYGARRAVDEFLTARNESPRMVSDMRGGCFFRKPA